MASAILASNIGATSTQISSGQVLYWGVCVQAGSDTATATVRNGGAAGTVVHVLVVAANSTSTSSVPAPVVCGSGLYITVAGTSPVVIGYYSMFAV